MVFALRPSHTVRQQFSSVHTDIPILFVLCLQSFFVFEWKKKKIENLHTRSRRYVAIRHGLFKCTLPQVSALAFCACVRSACPPVCLSNIFSHTLRKMPSFVHFNSILRSSPGFLVCLALADTSRMWKCGNILWRATSTKWVVLNGCPLISAANFRPGTRFAHWRVDVNTDFRQTIPRDIFHSAFRISLQYIRLGGAIILTLDSLSISHSRLLSQLQIGFTWIQFIQTLINPTFLCCSSVSGAVLRM